MKNYGEDCLTADQFLSDTKDPFEKNIRENSDLYSQAAITEFNTREQIPTPTQDELGKLQRERRELKREGALVSFNAFKVGLVGVGDYLKMQQVLGEMDDEYVRKIDQLEELVEAEQLGRPTKPLTREEEYAETLRKITTVGLLY